MLYIEQMSFNKYEGYYKPIILLTYLPSLVVPGGLSGQRLLVSIHLCTVLPLPSSSSCTETCCAHFFFQISFPGVILSLSISVALRAVHCSTCLFCNDVIVSFQCVSKPFPFSF